MLTASDPADDDGKVRFDVGCVANPVVLPPDEHRAEWQCYYYGNDGSWSGGRPCFLPTGSIGLAVSKDGLTDWTKVVGSEAGGAVLAPSEEHGAWDSVHTGLGDVVRVGGPSNELHMYYFGADDEKIAMGPSSSVVGLRMRVGRAISTDDGRTWTKDDAPVLDHDESEGLFASWPRIVVDDADENKWSMFYHSYDGERWRVFGAESDHRGDTWRRTGLVLEGDHEDENAFDHLGVGTRSVVRRRDGGLLMVYEGVDKHGKHRLGAAALDGDGGAWTKLYGSEPILDPGRGPLGDWTEQVIGTPCLVNAPDGGMRLYHCGKRKGSEEKMAIGVLVSESGDVGTDNWRAVA